MGTLHLVIMYFKISGIFGKWFLMFWLGKKRKIENFIFCKEHQIPSQILQHFQQSQQLCLLVYLLLVFEKNNLSGSRIHEHSNKRRFTSISKPLVPERNEPALVKLEWHVNALEGTNPFNMLNLACGFNRFM